MASSQEILEGLRRLEESLFQRLAEKLTIEIGPIRLEVNGRFDALEVRLDRLETEYQTQINAKVRELEARLAEE